MNIERRVGRFAISAAMLRNSGVLEDREAINAVFDGMVIIRCEHILYTDTLEYIALAPQFDEVPGGEFAPNYRCNFVTLDGVISAVWWEKVP